MPLADGALARAGSLMSLEYRRTGASRDSALARSWRSGACRCQRAEEQRLTKEHREEGVQHGRGVGETSRKSGSPVSIPSGWCEVQADATEGDENLRPRAAPGVGCRQAWTSKSEMSGKGRFSNSLTHDGGIKSCRATVRVL